VQPREQAGARTGALFEYQYHQAAAEALSLLDDANAVCVYCEWHDDYVTESAAGDSYAFNQVKTRQKSDGPWSLAEFFGLGRKRKYALPPVTRADSIFAHLWDHTRKFGDRCGRFVVVTDAGVDPPLEALLADTKAVKHFAELPPNSATHLANLRQSLAGVFHDVTDESLFTFLSRLWVREGVGTVRDLQGCRVLIASRILEASEVDLLMSEAKKIGADLVAVVRQRSHTTLQALPATPEDLRTAKGLVIDNLLRLLSLSTEGYRQLRAGGRESVLALSRLHRLCNRNNVAESLIPDLCRYKTEWAAWWIDQRDRVNDADYLALKAECADLLRAHSSGGLGFDRLVEESKVLAERYRERLTSSVPLRAELVVGLIIALAVESEG
jgi:hypothetical protein